MMALVSQGGWFFLFLFVFLASVATPTLAARCTDSDCGLLTDGAYEHFVVGTLVSVADAGGLADTLRWAKAHRYWRALPDAIAPYQASVRQVSIALPDGHAATLFMARDEFDAAPLRVGDLVRYRPHDPAWESPVDPQQKAIFWGLTGCVATLCTAGDSACRQRYRPGIYTLDGKKLNQKTGRTGSQPVVATDSLLPLE